MNFVAIIINLAGEERFSQYTFALVMFIFCMGIKVYGVYVAAHFFSAIGGAQSMEDSMNGAYDSLSNVDCCKCKLTNL